MLFAADDSWVALLDLGNGIVWIGPTASGSRVRKADLWLEFSEAEKTAIESTSCGAVWFDGWEATANGVRFFVNQLGKQATAAEPRHRLSLLIRPGGAIEREQGPKPEQHRRDQSDGGAEAWLRRLEPTAPSSPEAVPPRSR